MGDGIDQEDPKKKKQQKPSNGFGNAFDQAAGGTTTVVKPTNGSKPSISNDFGSLFDAAVKKKEVTQPASSVPANGSQSGTQNTVPSQSQSTSVNQENNLPPQPEATGGDAISSAVKGVANTISSLPPPVKVPPLQKVADLAKKQQDDQMAALHQMMPLIPQEKQNDLISQGLEDDTVKRVQAGDPNAISDVVGKQLAQINVSKQRLQEEKNKTYGGLYSGTGADPRNKEIQAQLDEQHKQAIDVTKDGIQALNTVYGEKLLASPDKSATAQNEMGAELRSHKAKIGADLSYNNEQGISDAMSAYHTKLNAPPVDQKDEQEWKLFMGVESNPNETVHTIIKKQDALSGTKQLEYNNRDAILTAAQQQLKDKYDAATTPEEKTQIQQDAISLQTQHNNLLNQYPQVKSQFEQQMVADLFAKRVRSKEKGELGFVEKMTGGRSLFSGISLHSDEDIKAIADMSQTTSHPMTEDEVRGVADKVNIPSTLGLAARGFRDSFLSTAEGLNRLTDSKATADIQNKNIEGYKYHAPAAFQTNDNLPNILNNMVEGGANMAGLATQMWLGGEVIGGATGLTEVAKTAQKGIEALSDADVATLGAASKVLPGNNFAQMMVDMGVAENKGEALGMVAKATEKAKHLGGTIASIGPATYEAAYQQASQYTNDESKRNEYASQSMWANILSMTILNPQAIVGKGLQSISKEEVMANYLKTGVPYESRDILKARIAAFLSPAVAAVPATAIPVVQEAISKENLFGIHTSGGEVWNEFLNRYGSMVLATLPFGGLAAAQVPTSSSAKAGIFQVGVSPDKSISNVEESFTKGDITEAEKNRQISLINTTTNLVNTVPDKNNVGKSLSQADKNELVYQQLQHAALLDKQSKSTEALKPAYDKELADTQSKIDKIMGLPPEEQPVQKPEPTLTQKRQLAEATSKYKENIKAIDELPNKTAAEKDTLKEAEDLRHAKELKDLQSPPLTSEQEVITKALAANEIQGVYKAAPEDAVTDPEKAKKFLSDAKDQIGNQVASAAGDPSALAKESFGKTIVDHVSPPETPPIDTKIEDEKMPTDEEFAKSQKENPITSKMDAETRLSNGDRIFAFHEQDELPQEIKNVGDLAGYSEEQLIAVPRKENPFKPKDTKTVSAEQKSDSEIEKRMLELQDSNFKVGSPEHKEFDTLEKEMEKRERASVFSVPLEKVNDAVDALMKKEKEQPNGFGSFIEKKDASETKEVANKYLDPKKITDAELKKDFKEAVMGNPDTWYADGLKLRESLKEAANRGIDTQDMVSEIEKEFIKDGYTSEEAKKTVARKLAPIFEGSQQVNEKGLPASQPIEQKQGMGAETENKISENETTNKQAGGEDKQGNQSTEEGGGSAQPPVETPPGAAEGGDPELTKIANAVNDALVTGKFGTQVLDDIISKLPDTDLQKTYGEVKEKIQKKLIDPATVRERVITSKSGSSRDQAVLLYDMAELKGREKALRQEIISTTDPKEQQSLQRELTQVENEMMDNALANRFIGRDWHNIGKIRQQWIDKDFNIATMQEEYMAAKGLTELSPEQKAEIQKYHDEIKGIEAERDKAKADLDKAITENESLKMENLKLQELKDKATEQKRSDRGKKSDEAVQKSNERIQKAKDELKRLRGNLNVGIDPKAALLITKIAAEYTYQGVVKLSELVKQVLDTVKDIFPTWTEKDVRQHLFGDKIDTEKYFEAGKEYDHSDKELKEKIRNYNQLQKDFALKMFEWQKDRRSDIMAKRPVKERIIDGLLRWQRFAVLTYPTTILKLMAVVVHQLALKPLKFAAQKLVASLTPESITSKQSLWGNPTWRSLGKYYSEFVKNFSLANLREQFSGIDTKEILYGDSYKYDEWAAAKGLLEMPGRSHGYIKSFIKNPEFKFAQENIATHFIGNMSEIENKLKDENISEEEKTKLKSEYGKWDITDPDVMERVNKLSLEHGRWAILMNDSKFVDKFRNFADTKGVTGALIRSELPILKIPVNYVSRAFATKYGLIRAIIGKGRWESKDSHFPGIIELMYKGTKDLTPEQADMLGRTLTIGTMGAAFFALGYMGRHNIKQNDDGSYNIFGIHVNKNFAHSLEFESVFSGAETGNSFEKKGNKNVGTWLGSFLESDIDIAKKSPFTSMLKYGFIPNVAAALLQKDGSKIPGKIVDAVANKVSNMFIPGAVKQSAGALDTGKPGYHLLDKPTYRKPQGDDLERFWQTIELGIPGLRKNVPER